MELEFDKEIDAILRKTRHDGSVAVASPHLDADVIAAFAENVVPVGARALYTKHLADCDRCRRLLSQAIAWGDDEIETAAVSPAAAAIAGPAIPWYQGIFRTPNLAIAMGGLILVFSGVLGFLVLQNDRSDQNATVSQVTEPESTARGPYVDDALPQLAANANVPAQMSSEMPAAANTAARPASNASTSAAPESRRSVVGERQPETEADDNIATMREMAAQPKPAGEAPAAKAAPPPPPRREAAPAGLASAAEERKKDDEISQAERSDASLARKRAVTPRSRDLPPESARAGPARGPVQNMSNQIQNNTADMVVTRSVGGRKFTNRDGAWYDTAYRGQATINVKRGTEEFKKLDSGLRSIAGRIEGVVVVVWRSRAYRIQ